jgi:hypothetical protein
VVGFDPYRPKPRRPGDLVMLVAVVLISLALLG